MTKSGGLGTARIAVKPATNMLHGVRFATDRDEPLNVQASINWHRLGLDDAEATRAFRAVRRKVRQRWTYLRQKGRSVGPLHDVGAHENPAGVRNTHWMVRVEPTAIPEFKRAVAKFLAKVVGLEPEQLGRALHIGSVDAPGTFAKYMAKGVHPAFADYFRIEASDQGFVAGRGRTFVSRSISRTARKAAGWTRKRRGPSPLSR